MIDRKVRNCNVLTICRPLKALVSCNSILKNAVIVRGSLPANIHERE
jgi:hypothetical protein